MNQIKSNADRFLTAYNDLDRYMRTVLNEDDGVPHSHMVKKLSEKNKVFSRYKDDLITFAKLRNAIVHNPDKKDAEPIAEPHEKIVNKYEQIKEQVINPPTALNTIAVKAQDIFTTNLDAKALNVMKEMNKNTYTHLPVIENKVVIGVFSENTILSYLVKNEEVIIEKDIAIKEFAEFIPLDKHESEYFKFVPKNTLLIDMEEMFHNEIEVNRRLAVIFITENGKSNEKILGLVTAWDVAGHKR